MKVSKRLAGRLEREYCVSITAIERIWRSEGDRNRGSWAWEAKTSNGLTFGSEDPMTKCVEADCLKVSNAPWHGQSIRQIHAEFESPAKKAAQRGEGE